MRTALVAGAGGFIGHHMVKYLKADGYWVRGVDVQRPEYESSDADEFEELDLRDPESCLKATRGVEEVYQLAADMGGIGYITEFHADVARNNVLINANMLESAHRNGVERYFFSSSACIYPMYRQHDPDVTPLKELDAYPADPEEGYGWEKLYAAICRKIALANDGDEIEIWGDGQQTRSFTYVDDCVEGIHRVMRSDVSDPLNLGSDRLISVDGLVDLVSVTAGKALVKRHDTSKPQGVRGRNSDNTRCREALDWEPSTTLEDGLAVTYRWIESQIGRRAIDPMVEVGS
jgi:GDP-D-mannose 3',5'-epimerase